MWSPCGMPAALAWRSREAGSSRTRTPRIICLRRALSEPDIPAFLPPGLARAMGSSNLAAQRRREVGLALLSDGAAAAAVSACEAALELDPAYPEALFSLGQALEAQGDGPQAVECYRRCLAADPTDVLGATVRLALLGAAGMPGATARVLCADAVRPICGALRRRPDRESVV